MSGSPRYCGCNPGQCNKKLLATGEMCVKELTEATELRPLVSTEFTGSVAVVGREHRFMGFDPIRAFDHSCPVCEKKSINENTKFCYNCGVKIKFTDY